MNQSATEARKKRLVAHPQTEVKACGRTTVPTKEYNIAERAREQQIPDCDDIIEKGLAN
jgi:hypothetical protein